LQRRLGRGHGGALARALFTRSLEWAIDAVAAAATGGGKAVVKINPGACDLTASTIVLLAAM
jgi:hypothetical protein